MGKLSGSRSFGMMSAVLAFALSAGLGLGFVMVVNKTHDLFADASETEVPSVAASLGWQEQTVVGTWEGKWHDVPSVTVTIGRKGDELTGTVVFQPIIKTQAGSRFTGAAVTLPLKDATFDGRTLRFKLDDSLAASDWREGGIEMTLTSANHAELKLAAGRRNSELEKNDFAGVVLTKTV